MRWAQKKGALLRVPGGSRLGASGARALFRPFRAGREGTCLDLAPQTGASEETGNLHGLDMIRQHIGKLGWRQPAKAAIGAQSKIGQILARRRDPFLEACHAVDGAEIDARPPRLELLEWREEGVVAAVEHRDVHPVDPSSGDF